MLARMLPAAPRTARKLRSTDHLLSCCVYGERFGRCVLRPGDACTLVGAEPLKPRTDAGESGFPSATPPYGSDSKSVRRPRPTRNGGVGLLLLRQNRALFAKSRPSAGALRGRHAAGRMNCLPIRVRIANNVLANAGQKLCK